MEGFNFNSFFTDIKESISSLKDEVLDLKKMNQGQNDEMVVMREEINRLKQSNSNLSEKLEALEKRNDTCKDELVPGNNKLVRGLQSELKRFQTMFTKEMDTMKMNAGKVEDTCDRLIRLQKMLNTLHMTVQQRKNLEDVVEDVMSRYSGNDDCICCHCKAQTGQATQASGSSKTSGGNDNTKSLCVVPPLPPSDKLHPSQCTRSSEDIRMEREAFIALSEESKFDVRKDGVGLSGTPVWICGFDQIKIKSKYMNHTTGVYRCPAKGKFKFRVDARTKDNYQLFLCSDRREKRQELTSTMEKPKTLWFTFFDWECDKNELIWLEGKADMSYLSVYIEFYGLLQL